ncbi:MAG TPA: hypothetical protein VGM44_17710 [Polyangiaceae bacterium]
MTQQTPRTFALGSQKRSIKAIKHFSLREAGKGFPFKAGIPAERVQRKREIEALSLQRGRKVIEFRD